MSNQTNPAAPTPVPATLPAATAPAQLAPGNQAAQADALSRANAAVAAAQDAGDAARSKAIQAAIGELSTWVEQASKLSDRVTSERARGIAERLQAALAK